jgi:hypothetical protein
MKARIIIASALILILLSGCKPTDPDKPPICRLCTWVAIDPIQCMLNPWEQEWLEEHPGEMYPLELEEMLPIIIDYYEKLGIRIYESKIMWTHNSVCLACSCPAGYTVYFQVSRWDVRRMLDLGFRVETPDADEAL